MEEKKKWNEDWLTYKKRELTIAEQYAIQDEWRKLASIPLHLKAWCADTHDFMEGFDGDSVPKSEMRNRIKTLEKFWKE